MLNTNFNRLINHAHVCNNVFAILDKIRHNYLIICLWITPPVNNSLRTSHSRCVVKDLKLFSQCGFLVKNLRSFTKCFVTFGTIKSYHIVSYVRGLDREWLFFCYSLRCLHTARLEYVCRCFWNLSLSSTRRNATSRNLEKSPGLSVKRPHWTSTLMQFERFERIKHTPLL